MSLDAVHQDATRACCSRAHGNLKQSRFSSSVRAEKSVHASRPDAKIDTAEHFYRAVRLPDTKQLEREG
jgi:hypothetical protein